MGTQLPSPKRGQSPPIFGRSLLWRNGWMHQDATWYGGRPQPRRLVLDGDPAPYPKRGGVPHNFRPTSIVSKRLHGSRCHLVRRHASAYATLCSMWTQLPPEKGHTHPHPIFGPCLLWPNVWMDEDVANWYGSRPRPMPHYCTGSQLPRKGHNSLPLFGPCLLWPRLPIPDSAELL